MVSDRAACPLSGPRSPGHLYFFAKRYIAVCNLIYERRIRVEDHNVKMLNCLDGFQGPPVLEPYILFRVSCQRRRRVMGKDGISCTWSLESLPPNFCCIYVSISARALSVRSVVTGSSSRSNLVHTTRCTMRLSIPYGQSFWRILTSSSNSKGFPLDARGISQCSRCVKMKFMTLP